MDSIEFKEDKVLEQFDTKKEPRKSLHTYLRNQNKLYINSFNIIDRKAAIMIRINSTIISVIIIFFNTIRDVPHGKLIGIILTVTCFLSLMLSLNASRPHFFDAFFSFKRNIKKRQLRPEETIFIPSAASNLKIEEYEKAFDKIIKDQKLQIGNQVRAMHIFEKRIRDSFSHIELAYLAFMLGFASTVILFVIGQC